MGSSWFFHSGKFLSLGMEFSAWAYTMGKALKELEQAADFILELNAGGTADGFVLVFSLRKIPEPSFPWIVSDP